MALNIVCWMPELFLLITFLALLCFGVTAGTTCFEERWAVPLRHMRIKDLGFANHSLHTASQPQSLKGSFRPQASVNTCEFLAAWALPWCGLALLLVAFSPLHGLMPGGLFVRDAFTVQLQSLLWLLAIGVWCVSRPYLKQGRIVHPEYVYLALLALMGQHLMIACTDLMSLYLCLELQSFVVVVLASLNFRSAHALEAGMKYFLLSAFSTCVLLFGIGLIYWETGLTQCDHLVEWFYGSCQGQEFNLNFYMGVGLVSLGLLWKLSVAPLHLWVADVYTGAWHSVALWLSTLPKVAGFAFWVHAWHPVWSATYGTWLQMFAALSLAVGALAPLAQVRIKRMMAFSSVGHMGFLLLPLCACFGEQSAFEQTTALWVYLVLYLVNTLGLWTLLMSPLGRLTMAPFTDTGLMPSGTVPGAKFPKAVGAGPQYLWDLHMLNRSLPALAAAWAVIMIGFAGIPPISGFLGKAYLFWEVLNGGLYGLTAVALVSTLISAVYYLRLVKIAYVPADAGKGLNHPNPTLWNTYETPCTAQAYGIAIAVAFAMVWLWCGTPLGVWAHWLSLKVSPFCIEAEFDPLI